MTDGFVRGEGGMAAAIRAFPWADTPLGPLGGWPAALRTTVATALESRFPQCIVWGEGLVTIPNDAFLPILGDKPAALGRSFADVWSEAWAEIGPIAAAAFAGESTFIEDFPLEVDRGRGLEPAWFTFCYSPIRDADGAVCGLLDTVVETTGKVRAHDQARLLAGELAHRMKNTLAVFQSIAHQTFRAHPGAAGHALLDERLASLSAAHDALTQSEWAGAPLREVMEGALRPHLDSPDRVTLDGPPVLLGGQQALSLALAVNELATNALKYGALSRPEGRVAVAWRCDPAAALPFEWSWRERGGPAVAPPSRRGFGTRLIERVLPEDFRGRIAVDFAAEGLRATLAGRIEEPADA